MKGSNVWHHFVTITEHKLLVMKNCFRVGLYKQGLLHDLSKYSPEEFWTGVRYYQGTRSPNAAEREEKGYSLAWLHHKGRNKHHFEYWLDFSLGEPKGLIGQKMPVNYVVEMVMDRIAACRVYRGKDYTDSRGRGEDVPLSAETAEKRNLLNGCRMAAESGFPAYFRYMSGKLYGMTMK